MKKELCAGTACAVQIASKLRFDRVELCQQLEIGGITPSAGLQQFSARRIETHVLIRERAGGFVYSSDEKEIMLADIALSAALGVHGVVVGALNEDLRPDKEWLKEARKAAGKLELTFHRAFDEVNGWQEAMETLIESGFQRILTSGQAPDVLSGVETLKSMKLLAAGRIEIMAGGGVRAENAGKVIAYAQPDAIHFSGTRLRRQDESSRYATELLLPDEATIAGILKVISTVD